MRYVECYDIPWSNTASKLQFMCASRKNALNVHHCRRCCRRRRSRRCFRPSAMDECVCMRVGALVDLHTSDEINRIAVKMCTIQSSVLIVSSNAYIHMHIHTYRKHGNWENRICTSSF